jgi:hypothetical protein
MFAYRITPKSAHTFGSDALKSRSVKMVVEGFV